MARSQNSYIKKVKAEKKRKKKLAKFEKKLEKKNQPKSGDLDSMMAYLDENGNIIAELPDKEAGSKSKDKDEASNNQ